MRLVDLFEDAALSISITEAGVGKIVQGVNTTPDVGVDEIPRQAAKFKIKVDRNGYPPVARSDGKIPKI
jgi:hypothetical protein